jgi:hypothetical protein
MMRKRIVVRSINEYKTAGPAAYGSPLELA